MTQAEHLEQMLWICSRLVHSPLIIMLGVIVVALMFVTKHWKI